MHSKLTSGYTWCTKLGKAPPPSPIRTPINGWSIGQHTVNYKVSREKQNVDHCTICQCLPATILLNWKLGYCF